MEEEGETQSQGADGNGDGPSRQEFDKILPVCVGAFDAIADMFSADNPSCDDRRFRWCCVCLASLGHGHRAHHHTIAVESSFGESLLYRSAAYHFCVPLFNSLTNGLKFTACAC